MDGKGIIGWALEIEVETHEVKVDGSSIDFDIDIGSGGNIDIELAAVKNLKTSLEVFIGCELESTTNLSSYAKIVWVNSELADLRKEFGHLIDEKLGKNDLKTINGKSLIITDPNDTDIVINQPEPDLLNCNMTYELVDGQIVWSCDHTWDEIYTAIQDGKIVRLLVDGTTFMPFIIQNTAGAFSNSTYIELENNSTYEWNVSFTYDNGVWELHNELTPVFTSSDKTKLDSIEEGAQVNVQSDWNQSDNSKDDYIKNKPTIPSKTSDLQNDSNFATQNDIPTESTVSDWGFTKNTGTITGITMNGTSKGTSGNIDLGTVITSHQDISGKADKVNNATNNHFAALDANGNLKDSGKKASDFATAASLSNYYTKSQVDSIVASVYKPQGSISSLSGLGSLDANHYGCVYNISSAFVTTSDFVEGADIDYSAGTNVVIINVGTEENPVYKYDVLASFVDLSPFARTENLAAVATSNDYDDLDNKPTIPAAANNAKLNIKKDANSAIELFSANGSTDKVLQILAGNNIALTEDTSTSNTYKLGIGVTGLANIATSGSYNDLLNRPILLVTINQTSTYDPSTPNNNSVFSNPSHTFSQIEQAIANNASILLVVKNSQFRSSEHLLLTLDTYTHNSSVSFMYVMYSNSNIIRYDISVNSSNAWTITSTTIPLSSGGISNLSALSDVNLNNLANGDILRYNNISSKWENTTISPDVFIINGTITRVDDALSLSCNKTIAEINAAHQAGKNVIMVLSDNSTGIFILPLTASESNSVYFTSLLVVFGLYLYYVKGVNDGSADEWNIMAHAFPNLFFSASYTDLVDTPTLGTAAALDVPASGNASTTEVVKGDDTRLSDARQASDVYPWAKAATKPSYTASEVGALPDTTSIPTKTSDLTNDSGFITSANIPTNVSDLNNDAGYISNETDPTVPSWAKANTKPSYTASEVGAIASSEKGANNGIAELDATGKVPSSQLPSYVDDVLEYASQSAFPATGESGKIYVALDTNKTYRWSGNAYVEISESLALGETSSTAYAGNKGKANADAIAAIKDGSTIDSFADVEAALTSKQDTINSNNKLSADLIEDGNNNKVFTSTEKTKLEGIEDGAEANVQADWNQTTSTADDFIKNKPTIPDAVSGVNDGTNWTSITIGSTTKAIPQGGSSTLTTLTDTTITTPSDGQVLTYDNATSKWVNEDVPTEIFNCTLTYTYDSGTNTRTATCDKSISDIVAAFNAGKLVILKPAGDLIDTGETPENANVPYICTAAGSSVCVFVASDGSWADLYQFSALIPSDNIFKRSMVARNVILYSSGLSSTVGVDDGWHYKTSGLFRNKLTIQKNGTTVSSFTAGNGADETINITVPTSSNDLSDINVSSPSGGQILKYNSTSSKWENASETTELPSITGNANKILAVNNGATGVEWVTKPSSGLTNYDFTHTANTTISGSTTTVTFAANTRGSAMLTISSDLGLTIACNNGSDNYIWVKNTGSSEVDIAIAAVTKNSTNVSNVYMPSDGISVPAGGLCEIGIIVNTDGAFITSRNDLAL